MAREAKQRKSRVSNATESKSKKRRNGRVSAKVRKEILKEVAGGRTALEVAKEYGIHNTSISRWKREETEKSEKKRSPRRREVLDQDGQRKVRSEVLPSRNSGRYTKEFKEDVLKQVFSGRKIVEVARQYSLPDRTINRWIGDWDACGGEVHDAKSTRPHASGATPIKEEHRALVLSLKSKHPNMGLAQVQNQLKRFQALKLSRHMIGRIFLEAGIPLQKRAPREGESDPAKNRFEMTRPGELWAVDFKEVWIHSEKAHAFFTLDDFSRFCVGFALTEKPTAELAIDTVNAAIQRYGRPERILSDRGPQFHAWNGVSQFDGFLADFLTDHSVTKANHPFTNGKLEAFNRSVEAELLDVEEFASLAEAEAKIRSFIVRYNFLRAHMAIGGLVPADRFFGMVEEAQKALEEGLKKAGPGLTWLKGLVSEDGAALRRPSILQVVLNDGNLELVVLGRRFTLR